MYVCTICIFLNAINICLSVLSFSAPCHLTKSQSEELDQPHPPVTMRLKKLDEGEA